MAKMPQACQDLINNAYAAAFSTCSPDGVPNVVPVSMKQAVDDETVMVSDQYLRKTLANLQANPRAALSAWDDEGGFQVKGTVTYENEGPRYEAVAAQVHEHPAAPWAMTTQARASASCTWKRSIPSRPAKAPATCWHRLPRAARWPAGVPSVTSRRGARLCRWPA